MKHELAGGDERRKLAADRTRARRVAFDPQPAPALDQELHAVALDAGLNPELDEGAALRPDAAEDFGNDAVLVVLAIDLVAIAHEPLGVGVARLLLIFSFVPIAVALIWYFQRARWHRVLHALRTVDV